MNRGLFILIICMVIHLTTTGQNLVPSNLIVTNDTGYCPPATFDLVANGGGGCEYSIDSIPYNTYPTGGTSVSMFDDQLLGPYPIGFSFDFYCNTYTQFYICSNGWIGFSAGQNQTWVVNPIPSAAFNVPRNVIMMPWRDWNPGIFGGPYITYQVQGTAPLRRLVVTFSSVPMFSCTTTYGTFQVVLFESTNIIESNLTNVPVCPQWGNGDGTHALHNLAGNVADIVAGRNDNSFTASNESWRFSLPKIEWIYQNDTVGVGATLEVSPSNGVYPTSCEYVYAVLDSGNGNIAIDSVLLSPFCIVPEFSTQAVLCNGDSTGNIMVEDTNSQATFPQTYFWMNASGDTIKTAVKNSSFDTLENVVAGNYSITIKDASGCYISNGSVVLSEPDVLVASISNPSMVSCPGAQTCDASAFGSATGGVQPYQYLWSSGEPFQTANNLCADSNFVTITDANGCTDDMFIVIDVPDTIKTTAFGDTMICITNPAAINAASTGGTPPYSYVWTESSLNGPVINTSASTVVNPSVTTEYFVTSTDDNGCIGDTSRVLIKVRPPLSAEIESVDTICPYDTIDISITAFGGDSTYTYSWSSGVFGSTITVSPDLPQWYFVTVSDQCGTPSFLDSVFVQVGGYGKISSKIRLEDDSICAGENVYLIAEGQGGFKGPDEYRYEWSASNMDGKPIQFARPTITTTYTLTITDLCLSPAGVAEKTVYVGKPYVPPFIANPNVSCTDTEVIISFAETMPGYEYDWDFGDGSVLENAFTDSVYHEFESPGCYDVKLSVTTDFGCYGERTENCLVQILQAPKADFTHYPTSPNTLQPFVKFQDNSQNAAEIIWYLDDDTLSESSLFMHEFADTGSYEVKLVAISSDGCIDTIIKPLEHLSEETIYIPKSFTPNSDGLNDEFKISGEGIGKDKFELVIFDRWGKQLFLTTNPDFGWNGKYTSTDEYVPIGSYGYTLQYVDRFGQIRKLRGQVIVSNSGVNRGLR
ncbi:MAG: PKD domain-containing protein [Salibacteraceae bacterium]